MLVALKARGLEVTQRQQTSMLTEAKILFMTSFEFPNGLMIGNCVQDIMKDTVSCYLVDISLSLLFSQILVLFRYPVVMSFKESSHLLIATEWGV